MKAPLFLPFALIIFDDEFVYCRRLERGEGDVLRCLGVLDQLCHVGVRILKTQLLALVRLLGRAERAYDLKVTEIVLLGCMALRPKILSAVSGNEFKIHPLVFVELEKSKRHGIDSNPRTVLAEAGSADEFIVRARGLWIRGDGDQYSRLGHCTSEVRNAVMKVRPTGQGFDDATSMAVVVPGLEAGKGHATVVVDQPGNATQGIRVVD